MAIDLGAESGRAVIGRFDGQQLALDKAHRFRNGPVRVAGHLRWDVLRILEEIQNGLQLAARQCGEIASVGIDTWGVDFGLLDRTGALIGNPYHYRDHRTDGVMDKLFARVPRAEVFRATGIQFMQLNTLYRLYAMALENSPALDVADTLLMMPDLLNYWLTGVKLGESTIATTTQFYDSRAHTWATGLLEKLGLPTHIMPRVIQPATELGPLLPAVAAPLGMSGVKVIAPACHNTGSAGWNIYITNVPASLLTLQQVLVMYSVRWQVELIFKVWKSQCALDRVASRRRERILTELYAKLIGVVVTHFLIAPFRLVKRELSMVKVQRLVRRYALRLALNLGSLEQLTTVLDKLIPRCLSLRSKTSAGSVPAPCRSCKQ